MVLKERFMKRLSLLTLMFFLLEISGALAHFLLLLPEKELITHPAERTVLLKIIFTHPMAGGPAMPLARPREAGVFLNGQKNLLTSNLTPIEVPVYAPWRADFNPRQRARAWRLKYTFSRPGDYIFYVIPQPYFEPAEGVFIQQITKVVVNAFGAETGWDAALGLPVEIVPLGRPYGLWEGNLFCGLVLKDGQPLKHATVEVEYLNEKGQIDLPSPVFETQVLKTNASGEFCYSFPWAGWWGFSVLTEGAPITKEGQKYPLELDAVFWLKVYPLKGH